MSTFKYNLLANFAGRIWTSLVGIVFVPVYIHFIGIEAYGLLGVFATLQAILGLLDMGLTTTLNRELARFNAISGNSQHIVNLVFTMERFYHLVALATGIALIACSWLFAAHWVNTEKLDINIVIAAFMLMGANFAFQFPASLYQGGLMGLQKQVSLNIILIIISSAKAIGAILVLYFISPSLIAFLTWQIVLSILQLYLLRRALWMRLPASAVKPFFDKAVIKSSGKYAAGIMGISLLTIILTQSDKIIVSKLVRLTEFGYYTLAATVAAVLSMVMFPITGAVFPKLTELMNKRKEPEMVRVFHLSSQLVSLIIIPLGAGLFIFSSDLIFVWTRNPEIAANAGPILRYLIIGSTINSLMTIPYQYTLSIGWLSYGINISIVAIIVFLPAIFFAAYKYGALGGAFMWAVLNTSYFIFAMLYLFSKHLTKERTKWYLADISRPLLVCILAALPFFFIHKGDYLNKVPALLMFGCCLVFCYLATLQFGTPALKPEIKNFLAAFKNRRR